jgi:Conserved TM helix/Mechanosensitive ion channel
MGFKILESLLLRLVNAIPNIIAAIAIALIGMLIAKAIAKLIERLLSTIGIDTLASKLNDIDVVQQYNINFKPSHIVGQVFYYVLMLVFLIAATDVLGMPAVSQLISDLINYVPNIITAMIVLIIGLLVANGLKGIVYSTCKSVGIPSANLVASFVFYFVFLTALMSGLSQAKIDTDFVKANLSIILGGGVAAFALGYGLASRDMMSNFLASFYSRRHFNIGDTIKVNETIGIIVYEDNTCIKMQSGERLIVVPLNKLMNNEIEILPSGRAELPENQ